MFRFTIIVTLMLIVSAVCINLSCNSCGIECAPACGTRRFRSCCFNYLRKKREDHEVTYNIEQPNIPVFSIDDPETWNVPEINGFKIVPNDFDVDNAFHRMYWITSEV